MVAIPELPEKRFVRALLQSEELLRQQARQMIFMDVHRFSWSRDVLARSHATYGALTEWSRGDFRCG